MSTQTYEEDQEYNEQCCLPSGTYTLSCEDSYGDGWQGGFIDIQGSHYCEGFLSGSSENIQLIIEGNSVKAT